MCAPLFNQLKAAEPVSAPVTKMADQAKEMTSRCPICIERSNNDLFFGLPMGAPCQLCITGTF